MFGHMTTVVWDAQCVQRRMGMKFRVNVGVARLSPLNGGGGGGGGGGREPRAWVFGGGGGGGGGVTQQQISLEFKAFKSSQMNDELNQKLLK